MLAKNPDSRKNSRGAEKGGKGEMGRIENGGKKTAMNTLQLSRRRENPFLSSTKSSIGHRVILLTSYIENSQPRGNFRKIWNTAPMAQLSVVVVPGDSISSSTRYSPSLYGLQANFSIPLFFVEN